MGKQGRKQPRGGKFAGAAATPELHLAAVLLSTTFHILFAHAQEATIAAFSSGGGSLNGLSQCRQDVVIGSSSCNGNNITLCQERCGLHGSRSLLSKCCAFSGISPTMLVYDEADLWVDRINEYNLCTGANVRIDYLEGGEDAMPQALIDDVGVDADDGEGIYDAYVVRAPWMPPIYGGLKSMSGYIKESAEFIKFNDIHEATRKAVVFDGQIYALPFDTHYISMGWRQDVFELHKDYYKETYGEDLTVPKTIEDLVIVSERLNGLDHNDDGVADFGFCFTPLTNNFDAFLAPVLQTNLRTCEKNSGGGYDCSRGSDTGQNIFFDVETFEPLIHNDGFKYAFELYYRFVRSSDCSLEECNEIVDFSSGRCAGIITLPDKMNSMLDEDGEYTVKSRYDEEGNVVWSPGQNLSEDQYWGRRAIFPGSRKVVDWNAPGRPLIDCTEDKCPLAIDGINYVPFFSQAGESYAINGRLSKPRYADAMWHLFAWFSELPYSDLPHPGIYRKSHLSNQYTQQLADAWNNEIMANDLHEVIVHNFKSEAEGGNPAQDSRLLGFEEYNDALDTEMHRLLIFGDISEGGLFNRENPSESIDPIKNKEEFDERYYKFISNVDRRFDEINARSEGGPIGQLVLWRDSLDFHPRKDEQDLCSGLLSSNRAAFDKLGCISVLDLKSLCQSQPDNVESYAPGTCSNKSGNDRTTMIIIILCSVFGGAILALGLYVLFNRVQKYWQMANNHKQIMEATLNESVRSLRQLDYPLHLVRGDEFVSADKILRHEVLRNTHRLTVLDTLSDVDAFIDAGKHIVFLSHQWTSFSSPDASGTQYEAMCIALKELAKQCGWDPSLKDIFVWVDYCCLPQANASIQNLAVRSLAAYAASATYFIIVAPETIHSDLDEICDIDTYQQRMWTRAEQVCHSMRNGTSGMFVAKGKQMPLMPISQDFFFESFRVFEGDLTCCRLEHKGMSVCDRQCLVIPLLGLYGELYRASVEGVKSGNSEALASVEVFLGEVERYQDEIFPPTFTRTTWRKNKQVTEEIVLFGDLIDRMKTRIKNGGGFAVDDDNSNTLTTIGSDFVRHGAVHGLRY